MPNTTVALRMPTELEVQITDLARREHRNRSQMMLVLLETGLAAQAPAPAGATSPPSTSDDSGAPELREAGAATPAYAAPQ